MYERLPMLIVLFILIKSTIIANIIDISKSHRISLLEHSQLYLDSNNLNLLEIIEKNLFTPYTKETINIGLQPITLWLKFNLHNPTNKDISKVVVLNSPILENINFYNDNLNTPILKGTAHLRENHFSIYPFFPIKIKAASSQTYYLKIKSTYSPVDFLLWIEDFEQFYKSNINLQLTNSLLIGFILSLILYNFILGFYTKKVSYFFYSLYLAMVVSQQVSYLGLLQVYFPVSITENDYYLAFFKVSAMVMTASLFAMYFLKTKNFKTIHKIYKLFIIIPLFELLLHYDFKLIYLETIVLTSMLFIVFNLTAAVIIYNSGNKQARLFIVGFGVVFLTYVMMGLDTLGISEFMKSYPNAVTWAIALEALVLSLAFADQYTILQGEKEKLDKKILRELKDREEMVQNEVTKKTLELNQSLQTKELLLQEINHRVKNNLQIILSIIRLQNDHIDDDAIKKRFTSLEYRINAIAKTYNMLLIKEDLQKIDMQEYIEALLLDIQEGMFDTDYNIEILTEIDAEIPLEQSVYIGLIINEIVTNAYKYAFEDNNGKIKITLHNNNLNDFILTIEENGKGYKIDSKSSSLGLKLIDTLVKKQLQGEFQKLDNNRKNIIRFKI